MANKPGSKQYSKRQTQQPRPANTLGEVLGTISGLRATYPKSLRAMLAAEEARNTVKEMKKTYKIKKD